MPAAATEPAPTPGPPLRGSRPIPRTRAAAAWAALTVGLAVLVVMLVFIIQNHKATRVSFLVWSWRLPLAIDLLLAALLGAVLVFLVGSVRILQLRRHARSRPEYHGDGSGPIAPQPGPGTPLPEVDAPVQPPA